MLTGKIMWALWGTIRSIAFIFVALLFSYVLSSLFIVAYVLLLNIHWLLMLLILLLYASMISVYFIAGITWIFSKLAILLRPFPKVTNIILIIIYICVSLFTSGFIFILHRGFIHFLLWLFFCGLPWSLNSWLWIVGQSIKEQKDIFAD